MAKPKYTKWLTPEGLILLEGWARDGLTHEQIAHNMGITRKTLQEWLNQFRDISDAVKKGREVCVYEVENALFKKSQGYKVTLQKRYVDEKGNKRIEEVEQYIPPSEAAGIFILKNRRPDKWRDKPAEPKADNGILHDLMELMRHD